MKFYDFWYEVDPLPGVLRHCYHVGIAAPDLLPVMQWITDAWPNTPISLRETEAPPEGAALVVLPERGWRKHAA